MLSDKNKHINDTRVTFKSEGHKYWIDGCDKDLISSTKYIHNFFNDFDTDTVIGNIIKSNKYKDPDYQYYKMSFEDIKALWSNNSKSAMNEGTDLHQDIENFYNGIVTENHSIEYKHFLKFYEEHQEFEIYRTEWLIFSDILKITGSIDVVFINDDGSLSLGDWKRSKEITKTAFDNKCGKYPISHIPDCNYYHYSLQLNLYRVILEKFYGQKVKEMFLVVLYPTKDNYEKIYIERMDREIEMMFDYRKTELMKKGYRKENLDKVKLTYTLEDVSVGDDCDEEEVKPVKSFLRSFKQKQEVKPVKSFLKSFKQKAVEPVVKKEVKAQKMITIESLKISNLSEKQRYAFNLITKRKNIFLTGRAGSGKTAIIRLFQKEYKNRLNIGVTSTTGTSAILINGATLHSYLGIGLGTGDVEILYMGIKNKSYILKRWIELDTLIIDEVSMLSPELFDKIENLARVVRKNDLPFGGIQLVVTGDFLQLPCVNSEKFCFESKSWEKCITNVVHLNENFRQDDPEFQTCLNEVRMGELSEKSIELLKSRENVTLSNEFGILPTKICSLNREVDLENTREVEKLFQKNPDLDFYEYHMEYEILKKGMRNMEDKIKKSSNAPSILELCIGIQVMLLHNLDLEAKLANGSRGIVVKFIDDMPVVKFLNGEERIIDRHTWKIQENGVDIVSIKQIPLRVAFSITTHKCQGITLDYAEVDLDNVFEDSQAYVALSRVKTLQGLCIRNFKIESIFANEKAKEFYNKL